MYCIALEDEISQQNNEHDARPPTSKYDNLFTNESISIYLDKHSCMSLDTNDFLVNQISHLSKGMVIVASA